MELPFIGAAALKWAALPAKTRKALGWLVVTCLCITIASCILDAATKRGEKTGKAEARADNAEASLKATQQQVERERAANMVQNERDEALDKHFDEVEKNIETEIRAGRSGLDAAFDGLSRTPDSGGKADQPAPRKDGVR